MRAVVADDDRSTALMLSRTLEKWDYEVAVTHDGSSALDAIIKGPAPSLAILDWMMPGLDGIEVCRRVRQASLSSYVYLMLLTSRSSRQDLVAGLDAGADDYLTKPFDPEELHARVRVGQRMLALLANIKQLSGLLPICSYCKRIRADENYWEQVESYITDHSGARFTHGICPTCFEKVAAEIET
jgi:sigma-B regulation protein RsbU (phosphoserine phosphatase)